MIYFHYVSKFGFSGPEKSLLKKSKRNGNAVAKKSLDSNCHFLLREQRLFAGKLCDFRSGNIQNEPGTSGAKNQDRFQKLLEPYKKKEKSQQAPIGQK